MPVKKGRGNQNVHILVYAAMLSAISVTDLHKHIKMLQTRVPLTML